MSRRNHEAKPENTLAATIARAGETPRSVSIATHVPLVTLVETPLDMTVNELGSVGGFLRISPAEILRAIA